MIRNQTGLWQWVLAFILSIGLWVFSMDDTIFTFNNTLPLSAPAVSSDFIVLGDQNQDSVDVTFSGNGFGVLRDQLTRHPESIQISINVIEQNQVFPLNISRELSEDNIVFSGDRFSTLSTPEFIPGTVEFTIDRSIIRVLPVSLTSSTAVPERYYWSETSNSFVEVKGAESIVNMLDSCYTRPLDPAANNTYAIIAKPEGIAYINPSSVSAELIPPVRVITLLN